MRLKRETIKKWAKEEESHNYPPLPDLCIFKKKGFASKYAKPFFC